jgi:single-stranded DNA-binding protein
MNSCVLMAEVVKNPELRYTPDNLPIAEMLVQFPGQRPEDPSATIKAVGFGNLASEIQQSCHQGDRVILEGRLTMTTIDRPEGFKEKRAELRVGKVHSLGSLTSAPMAAPVAPPANANYRSAPPPAASTPRPAPAPAPAPAADIDYDEIPF